MPAPVTSPSLARPVENSASQKPRPRTRKPRTVRRRGRAHDAIESDEEIEREVGSDSESDVDDVSSSESETEDSDTEPASEDVADNNPHPAESSEPPAKAPGSQSPFFAPTSNWSEMVADENANGPSDLPVIDFSEFDGHAIPATTPASRRVKKPSKKPRSAPAPDTTQEPAHEEPARIDHPESTLATERPSGPPHPRRPHGQSARQAYQQRLETDPSFVPKVGGFWGHDDRLMDKDLRSLSPWWRGRWQGNFRGRGRGRGAFASNGGTPREEEQKDVELPPIEKQWTHDRFEEIKEREERQASQGNQKGGSFRGGQSLRGARGGFVSNRGGRGGFGRGGFLGSPRARGGSPLSQLGRRWYSPKVEPPWTRKLDGGLFYSPRPGYNDGIVIKLPGNSSKRIPVGPKYFHQVNATPIVGEVVSGGSDLGERLIHVRLPKVPEVANAAEPLVTGEEPPIDEVFTVRPNLVATNPIPLPVPSATNEAAPSPALELAAKPQTEAVAIQPAVISQLEQLTVAPKTPDPERQLQTELAVLRRPSLEGPLAPEAQDSSQDERPPLPPLQTVFTPPPPPISQPSPAYGSPYGYAPLPPGVSLNQHGMPYEVATGRPVYLQPPTMYNPRSYVPTHTPTFVPGHMHHPSAVSPDFLAQTPSHTPPVNGFIDPATGTPIFSFPRQTSRIEIRAPSEENSKPSGSKSVPRTSSTLRTSAPSFEPPRQQENGYYYDGSYEAAEGAAMGEEGQVMGYPPYQQPYYYPEAYGYPQYIDMSQAGQYDMYQMEHHTPPGTVYY